MNSAKAKEIVDKIVGQVFGYQNPLSLEQFMSKFAFDIRLPQQVYDSTTNKPTWTQSTNPTKFIKMNSAFSKQDEDEWDRPAKKLNSIEDIMAAWNDINYSLTERQLDSENVAESDNIYTSQNVFRSLDIHGSKNIVFSDYITDSEFIAASQRSKLSNFCIRLDDSVECSNSFGLSWTGKSSNSFFLHACNRMQDSMFCTSITDRRFCVANMQFDEAEYKRLREIVIRWILTS